MVTLMIIIMRKTKKKHTNKTNHPNNQKIEKHKRHKKKRAHGPTEDSTDAHILQLSGRPFARQL